jgi:hypothetical protein
MNADLFLTWLLIAAAVVVPVVVIALDGKKAER